MKRGKNVERSMGGGFLVVACKPQEGIRIGDSIILVSKIRPGQVRLAIRAASRDVLVEKIESVLKKKD